MKLSAADITVMRGGTKRAGCEIRKRPSMSACVIDGARCWSPRDASVDHAGLAFDELFMRGVEALVVRGNERSGRGVEP